MFTKDDITHVIQQCVDESLKRIQIELANTVHKSNDFFEAKLITGKGVGIAQFAQLLAAEFKNREADDDG